MSGVNLEVFSQTVNQLSEQISNRQVKTGFDKIDTGRIQAGEESGGATFGNVLKQALNETNELSKAADAKIEELVAGRSKDLHGTMIALEKADVSLRLMMQLRNKMIDAYQEIMRMQV